VAAKLVAAAQPDGHTMLVITGAVVINAVTSKEGVDPRSQLTALSIAASAPTIFAGIRPLSGSTLRDHLRNSKGGHFTYATAGIGTAEHLTAEYVFKAIPGLRGTHIPYPGGGAAVTAVLGQQVDVVLTPVPTAMPFMKDGRLRALAVASHKRIPALPEVPTLAETGLPDFENMTWVGFFLPAKVSGRIVALLNAEINAGLQDSQVRSRLSSLGFDAHTGRDREAENYIKNEVEKWSRLVKTIGFTPN
jgi:tripartite-type tricarboxylate transporter receptor subunit TctC